MYELSLLLHYSIFNDKKTVFNGLIENDFSFFSISPSKNPYGNKTINKDFMKDGKSYSSKNPYGNKTYHEYQLDEFWSYSSKNPYGNKTSYPNLS